MGAREDCPPRCFVPILIVAGRRPTFNRGAGRDNGYDDEERDDSVHRCALSGAPIPRQPSVASRWANAAQVKRRSGS